MAIVRTDKRDSALARVGEMREALGDALLRIDAIQASLEDLEVELGLISEGEQDKRERHTVMHFPQGTGEGHSVEGCIKNGCEAAAADEMLEGLEGDGDDGEERTGPP